MVNTKLVKEILEIVNKSDATVSDIGETLNCVMHDIQARAEFGATQLPINQLLPTGAPELPQEYQMFYAQLNGEQQAQNDLSVQG